MYLLFIFESIGTSELILIGIVALIVFGPRKLPEIAKKFGKTMSEFRNATNDFKQTWEREVNLEQIEEPKTVAQQTLQPPSGENVIAAPLIREIDQASIPDHFNAENRDEPETVIETEAKEVSESEKKNWL